MKTHNKENLNHTNEYGIRNQHKNMHRLVWEKSTFEMFRKKSLEITKTEPKWHTNVVK